MNKQTHVLGSQDKKDGVDELLKKAGKDKVIDAVVKGEYVEPRIDKYHLEEIAKARYYGDIHTVAFSPLAELKGNEPGYYICVGCEDFIYTTKLVGKDLSTLTSMHIAGIKSFAFGPGAEYFAMALELDDKWKHWVKVVPFQSHPIVDKPVAESAYENPVCDVAFSPGGHTIAIAGRGGMHVARFNGHHLGPHVHTNILESTNSVDFHPSGEYVAFGCDDGYVRIFHGQHFGLVAREKPKIGVGIRRLSFRPDGRELIMLNHPYTSRYKFDGKKLEKKVYGVDMLSFHSINDVSFSPDGKLLAIAEDKYVIVYRLGEAEHE